MVEMLHGINLLIQRANQLLHLLLVALCSLGVDLYLHTPG